MDYGYINARMRGMKSRLLTRRELEDLIFKPDLESLASELEKTPYHTEILEARSRHGGILCIECALRENFASTFRKIQKIAGHGEAGQYIAIFLHRWDVQNIKTILRGKNIHATSDEIIDTIIPAGELDEATFAELVKQPDARAVIDLLASWKIPYSAPLTRSYPAFAKSGDLAILENALDKFYYLDALESVSAETYNNRLIREVLQTEIDVMNIRTILRTIRDHVDAGEAAGLFLEGGRVFDTKALSRLAALHSTEDLVHELEPTPYHMLAGVAGTALNGQKISVFEKELEKYLIKKGVDSFAKDPLSVASLIGYFWAKYNEMTNIRIIARCKTADVPDDFLKEELVYV